MGAALGAGSAGGRDLLVGVENRGRGDDEPFPDLRRAIPRQVAQERLEGVLPAGVAAAQAAE